MSIQDERLRTLLVRYGEAFATEDLKTVADCYAVPLLVLSDAGSIPVATCEEVEAVFQGAAQGYHAQGLVGARPTIVGSEAITERPVSADVRWD